MMIDDDGNDVEKDENDDHGNDEGGDDDEFEDNHLRGSRLLVGGCSLLMPSWHLDPPPASCKSLASPLDPPAWYPPGWLLQVLPYLEKSSSWSGRDSGGN